MPHIFISYAKKDTKPLALDLANQFNALEDVTAWVDVEGIDYGDEWETLIQRQIARCDYMVVLYSPDINRHIDDELQTESYVIKEIRYAQMRKKPIIPVMAQETHPPMGLISIQYIDYVGERLSSAELVNRLCRRMKITPTQKVDVISPISGVTIPQKPKITLPQPFEWCYIPAGKAILTPNSYDKQQFYITHDKSVYIPAFWMSKYPVTNAQYREFIDDGGYLNETWWTRDGLKRLKADGWEKPDLWDKSKWNGDEYPVVSISWYEAVAFCNWLRHKTGNHVMLPSDAEWQRAAQGDTGYIYPWGNEWNGDFCNNNVKPNEGTRTMPVTHYEENGKSPYDVVDMAGNIFEWNLTLYHSGRDDLENNATRIARGGSWHHDLVNQFTTTYRSRNYSYKRYSFIGFRIACQIDPR